MNNFETRYQLIQDEYIRLIGIKNEKQQSLNGIYSRYKFPIITPAHIPINWKYDLNPESNPHLLERFGINATFNAGAIKLDGKYLLIVRVEGMDRKSFFAVAESDNGIDGFEFWERPIVLPETGQPDTNVYDMRVVAHEDGWIYGLFCTERKDPAAPKHDQSMAVAQCGIARTKDLVSWERLADLKTPSPQQRNVVLHPEFVSGQYAFFTRPQDGFIESGKGGGIGFGLSPSIKNAVISEEIIVDNKNYHTVYEAKNGMGPEPIKTEHGWLFLAHGVRNTAAGLRYVLYMFMTALDDVTKVTHKPAGYFIAPEGDERVGDVSNVVFSNGWIVDEDGRVLIYYASSDTRMHVATSSVELLTDYVMNTPADGLRSALSVKNIVNNIEKNSLLVQNQL